MDGNYGELCQRGDEIIREGFAPDFGASNNNFIDHDAWQRLRETGTVLWLDTADIAAAADLWAPSMAAMTTNNSLLNAQVQAGEYDDLIAETACRLAEKTDDADAIVREIGFILNARHGLRIVETFDAFVSVELHTDLAFDIEGAVTSARRLHRICPERFIVKIPLTCEGLIAAARLSAEGVPVNMTLGFSARQNMLAALVARPDYCNVFLGRLTQVVIDNNLGDGQWVGERATSASQKMIRELRHAGRTDTRQIAASVRNAAQIRALAGVDVITMSVPAATEYRDQPPAPLMPGVGGRFEPIWTDAADPEAYGLQTLWEIPLSLSEAAEEIAAADLLAVDGAFIRRTLEARGLGDLMPAWADKDIERVQLNGKIPTLGAWRYRLAAGQIGLDALMNLSGLFSFAAAQKALDDRIRQRMR